MKTLSFLSIITCCSLTTSAQQVTSEDILKRICGTWNNTMYSGGNNMRPQKMVFNADKTFEVYDRASKESPTDKGDFNVLESWGDKSGNMYCKATMKSVFSVGSSFALWKFDKPGNKWESKFTFTKNAFPRKVDSLPGSSAAYYYSIYARQHDTVHGARESADSKDYAVHVYATPNGKSLKVYVFQPRETRKGKRRSAIALFHGGGWTIGEPQWAFELAEHFASLGMVGVAVQYRLSDQLSVTPLEAMADARMAIHWIRSNAVMLDIDQKRIAAYGWSAGAHLAVSAAVFTDTMDSAPNALVLVSPAVYIEGDALMPRLLGSRAAASSVSPASHIRKGLPPTLLLIGRHDKITPLKGVQLFRDRMQAAGDRCDLQIFEGVGHMFTPDSIRGGGRPRLDPNVAAEALKKADEFLGSLGFIN